MSKIYEIADGFVEKYAAADPVGATFMGVAGHEGELTDYSPEGTSRLNSLSAGTLIEIERTKAESERDRVCKDTVLDEQRLSVELFEAQEHLRNLNTMHCPV